MYNYKPPPLPPDEFAYYVPYDSDYPRIEVFEGGFRRKITQEGWATIERYYSVRWFDVIVIGGEGLHGRFEIISGGRTLAKLIRQQAVKKWASTKGDGTCPKCGAVGKFIRMALVCPYHG